MRKWRMNPDWYAWKKFSQAIQRHLPQTSPYKNSDSFLYSSMGLEEHPFLSRFVQGRVQPEIRYVFQEVFDFAYPAALDAFAEMEETNSPVQPWFHCVVFPEKVEKVAK